MFNPLLKVLNLILYLKCNIYSRPKKKPYIYNLLIPYYILKDMEYLLDNVFSVLQFLLMKFYIKYVFYFINF